MDMWTHRQSFKARVRDYRISRGKVLADVAGDLDIEESTLKDYLYRKDVKPSIAVLQRAAALFGCSVTEFMDDPGAAVAGQSLEGLSETRRFVARLMLEDLKAEDLSDDDVRILMEDHQRALERLRALKGRTGK